MIHRIIEKIENQPVTISQWMIGFTGILFVRFILESLSSPTPSGIPPIDAYTLVHYGLFFLTVFLGLTCIVGFSTKNFTNSAKFILFILPLTWLAPIIDIILSKGKGFVMSYILDTPRGIVTDFFKFPSLQHVNGITYGMHTDYILLLAIIGFYVWSKRKNFKYTILSLILSYVLLFLIGILPSLLYVFSHLHNSSDPTPLSVIYYMKDLIINSNIFHNTLHESALSVSPYRFLQLGFDKLMSQIFFIISFIFGTLWFWKSYPEKFKAVVKNSRPERIAIYLSFILIGMSVAYFGGYGKLYSWVDILSFICLMFSWLGIWLYAVQINDIADIEIDKISNSTRPLVQKTLTLKEMEEMSYLSLALALIGSWSAGFYPFFMSLVGIAVSYIYSSPPLRLKRVPILSSFLISIVCLAATLAGFFFISIDKKIQAFPILLAVGIVIMFTLEINFRDMKDIEGDRALGINTLPVIFGKNGPKVVGLCLALGFLLLPIFLSFYALYIVAIPSTLIGYKLITRKFYEEKYITILHFAFLAGIAVLTFCRPWLLGI